MLGLTEGWAPGGKQKIKDLRKASFVLLRFMVWQGRSVSQEINSGRELEFQL